MELKNKVVLITGASMGIGRFLCEHLSSQGLRVAAAARSVEKLKTLEEKITENGNNISTFQLDVTDFDGIGKVVKEIEEKWGTIDILINNAGTNVRTPPIESITKEEIDQVIDTNLKGTVYVTRQVVPLMIKAKKGHIINLSSTASLRGAKGNGLYQATKSGINIFGDSMTKALMEYNIYVTTLCPGAVNTSWWDRPGSAYIHGDGDRSKIMQPSQIARLVDFVLDGDSATLFNRVILTPVGEVGTL